MIHDWGSFFGFHYAMRHPENVKGLAFMGTIVFPVPGYEAFDDDMRQFFQTLRSSQEAAETMTVEWCSENLPVLETVQVGAGTHYIQEDCPQAIGQAIAGWMERNGI